uniref:malate synthase n=1 Tax=Globisporangium ultimum (strain ATCC 200006 / CBS 805.95 / DAOM BR144) TaxID=431595 RepID=K3WEJ9_GLOUD
MDRIMRLQKQLRAAAHDDAYNNSSGASASALSAVAAAAGSVHVSQCDAALDAAVYDAVLTPQALAFVAELASTFARDVEQLHQRRSARRVAVEQQHAVPTFLSSTKAIRNDVNWKIDPIPPILRDRRVDIGDVSPANREFLLCSLNSGAQGVQVDFDDGHCPTWKNTLLGHFNIMEASRGTLAVDGATLARDPALLLVRPRAWNMDEMNMLVNGTVVPGAVFDFGVHLFHNGKLLFENGRGPFLYLPKLEGFEEAALWRNLFVHAEKRLGLPMGGIKATVLIENIFAAFEMDEILYELRHHSSGLNCGMWDYTASIVVNFRHDKACLLPDRQQCVSMRSDFLKHYMELLIRTCKRRGAPATTGMVPFVLDQLPPSMPKAAAIEKAKSAKLFEAVAGSDGALVYDLALVAPIQEVFTLARGQVNATLKSLDLYSPVNEPFYEKTLLMLPQGYVTKHSVELNLRVALFYVLGWFYGHGTVVVNGCVEDSATAEISRAQLWQWIRHQVPLDKPKQEQQSVQAAAGEYQFVNANLIRDLLLEITRQEMQKNVYSLKNLVAAMNLVFRVVTMRSPPLFMTTFLLEQEPLTKSLEQ